MCQKTLLLKCLSLGEAYDPIKNLHPVVAAKLGLSFYRSFVDEAEVKYSIFKNTEST